MDKKIARSDYEMVFKTFTQHNADTLSKEELIAALRKFGADPDLEVLDQLFSVIDADGSGAIDLDEFIQMVDKLAPDISDSPEVSETAIEKPQISNASVSSPNTPPLTRRMEGTNSEVIVEVTKTAIRKKRVQRSVSSPVLTTSDQLVLPRNVSTRSNTDFLDSPYISPRTSICGDSDSDDFDPGEDLL